MKYLLSLYLYLTKNPKVSFFITIVFSSLVVYGLSIKQKVAKTSFSEQHNYLALAQKYADGNLNFFTPETYILNKQNKVNHDTHTAVQFPIVPYIVGIILKITGQNDGIWFSIINWMVGFIALFYLYKTVRLLMPSNTFLSLIFGLFIFLSPFYVFYSLAYLPLFLGLCFILIGFYHYIIWFLTKKNKYGLLFNLFFVLAILIEFNFIYLYIALVLYYTFKWFFGNKDFPNILFKGGLGAIIILLSYSFYNSYLKLEYGTVFDSSFINPVGFKFQLNRIKNLIYLNFTSIFTSLQWLFIFLLAGFAFFIRWIQGRKLSLIQKHLLSLAAWIGGIALIALYFKNIDPKNEGLFITFIIIPIIIVLIVLISYIREKISFKEHRWWMVFSILFIIGFFIETVSINNNKWNFALGSDEWINNIGYEQSHNFISSNVIHFGPNYGNFPFTHIKTNGFIVDDPIDNINQAIKDFKTDTLLIDHQSLFDILKEKPNFYKKLSLIKRNWGVGVYQLKNSNSLDPLSLLNGKEFIDYNKKLIFNEDTENYYWIDYYHEPSSFESESFSSNKDTLGLIELEKIDLMNHSGGIFHIKTDISSESKDISIKMDLESNNYKYSTIENVSHKNHFFTIPKIDFDSTSTVKFYLLNPNSNEIKINSFSSSYVQLD